MILLKPQALFCQIHWISHNTLVAHLVSPPFKKQQKKGFINSLYFPNLKQWEQSVPKPCFLLKSWRDRDSCFVEFCFKYQQKCYYPEIAYPIFKWRTEQLLSLIAVNLKDNPFGSRHGFLLFFFKAIFKNPQTERNWTFLSSSNFHFSSKPALKCWLALNQFIPISLYNGTSNFYKNLLWT